MQTSLVGYSQSPRELRLTSGGYPLASIAEALRAPHVADVWANGLLARNAHISLNPSGGDGDSGGINDLDDELEVRSIYGELVTVSMFEVSGGGEVGGC